MSVFATSDFPEPKPLSYFEDSTGLGLACCVNYMRSVVVICSSEASEVSSRDPGCMWTSEPTKRLNSKQMLHYSVTSRTPKEVWDLSAKKHFHKTLQTPVERNKHSLTIFYILCRHRCRYLSQIIVSNLPSHLASCGTLILILRMGKLRLREV